MDLAAEMGRADRLESKVMDGSGHSAVSETVLGVGGGAGGRSGLVQSLRSNIAAGGGEEGVEIWSCCRWR